jgi:hypothetical protein
LDARHRNGVLERQANDLGGVDDAGLGEDGEPGPHIALADCLLPMIVIVSRATTTGEERRRRGSVAHLVASAPGRLSGHEGAEVFCGVFEIARSRSKRSCFVMLIAQASPKSAQQEGVGPCVQGQAPRAEGFKASLRPGGCALRSPLACAPVAGPPVGSPPSDGGWLRGSHQYYRGREIDRRPRQRGGGGRRGEWRE